MLRPSIRFWTGLATPQQAREVMSNLKLFEQPGGLVMSNVESGVQWDKPYGWAPIHLIAIEGMRHYGFNQDANRISKEFLGTVLENFRRMALSAKNTMWLPGRSKPA